MNKTPRITVAHGDGIGPEIMAATLNIMEAAGANVAIDTIEIGEKVYQRGLMAGIEPKSWQNLLDNKVFLKAPITTPQGGGFKSLNVTVRKTLGLYANVRPCRAYSPFVRTKHPKMDLVIIRENEEDLYAGIEHRQTDEVYQCLKLITRPGCEKIVRYAFEYAVRANRKKVTCFTKDNIMKMTDGLFHKVFDEIGAEYPSIEKEHWIVDIGAAKIADTPEVFDVVVMPNLYGDILSDVTAQIAGSVGLAGSSNIGEHCAMFEAIHGSAPRRANQNLANPSGLILASVQMLNHMGQGKVAEKIHNAWLKTIEDGLHTYDIYQEGISKKKVGTKEFAMAVSERMNEVPQKLGKVQYNSESPLALQYKRKNETRAKKELVGIDVFVQEDNRNVELLAEKIKNSIKNLPLELQMITNRGVKVYPEGLKETFCTDHWRCRLVTKNGGVSNHAVIWMLMKELSTSTVEVIKTENLYLFDGEKGYSAGQGQ
ncbi:NADP-dependent isocitrate dehydrogenase [bacterium]|nr:NADP-dependent isocitrate dehydrogenase [bacterium]